MNPTFVLALVALIAILMLIFVVVARQRDIVPSVRRAGPPVPGLRHALTMILLGAVMLGIFILASAGSSFASRWRTWYELRGATALAQARVLAQQCITRRSSGILIVEDTLVTYQFEATLANGTRRLITQKLQQDGGKGGCTARDSVPKNIAIRYDPHDPSIAGLADGPDIGTLIVGTVLGLVWLVLMSLLPIAAGLDTLLSMLDRHRADPLKAAQDEQERRELEAEGFMLITSPELQHAVERAVRQGTLAASFVAQRGDRRYLSFGFIADPARRKRTWDLFWRYQARHAISGSERQEIMALQFEILGDSALAQSLRAHSTAQKIGRPGNLIGAFLLNGLLKLTIFLGLVLLLKGAPLIGVPLIFIPLIYSFGVKRSRQAKQ